MIEARIICDSVGAHSPRLTTFQLRYPKFIHGEFMTHRMFSRNASSSRAIPVSKSLEEVRSDELRAAPVWWGREQKGMQSGEELDTELKPGTPAHHPLLRGWSPRGAAQEVWKDAALRAATFAEELVAIGAHKSIVNRILEPFLHINVVATSCEPGLMNFFGLRLDRAAQPEIRVLAEQMWAAWQESRHQKLKPGQWHLPFVEHDDLDNFDAEVCLGENDEVWNGLIKISVARCARVSYLSHETGRRSTIDEDLALYDRLVGSQPLHASPAEHQATPDTWLAGYNFGQGCWDAPEHHGNLPGWRQYRKTLPGEAVAPLPKGWGGPI